MHCLHCCAAAQHLSVQRARAETREAHSRGFTHADMTAGRVSCEKMEKRGAKKEGEGKKEVRWVRKMNGQAEGAASMGKLDNECLSLASMMDEWGMVFVTNAIFFESLGCSPAEGRGWQAGAAPHLSSSSVAPNRVINI